MGRVDAPGGANLSVTVVFSPSAGEIDAVELSLPEASTVADAVRESGVAERHAGIDMGQLAMGVWGVLVAASERLRDRDRVEIYRPLTMDPKEARRLRQQKQRGRVKR